jgi:hypothetical protein
MKRKKTVWIAISCLVAFWGVITACGSGGSSDSGSDLKKIDNLRVLTLNDVLNRP